MLKLRKNKKGFTLVELIVVIAIMAVLAGTVAGVTVSQLNKQTNNSAKSEVNTLMEDFKTFLLDYQLPTAPDAAITGFTKVDAEWTPDNGINTKNELTYAVLAFAKEAKETKGLSYDILDASDHKAGDHKFTYSVEGTTVTFSCKEKGASDKEIKATYEYKDVLGD